MNSVETPKGGPAVTQEVNERERKVSDDERHYELGQKGPLARPQTNELVARLVVKEKGNERNHQHAGGIAQLVDNGVPYGGSFISMRLIPLFMNGKDALRVESGAERDRQQWEEPQVRVAVRDDEVCGGVDPEDHERDVPVADQGA
jgi:hypothetical protein